MPAACFAAFFAHASLFLSAVRVGAAADHNRKSHKFPEGRANRFHSEKYASAANDGGVLRAPMAAAAARTAPMHKLVGVPGSGAPHMSSNPAAAGALRARVFPPTPTPTAAACAPAMAAPAPALRTRGMLMSDEARHMGNAVVVFASDTPPVASQGGSSRHHRVDAEGDKDWVVVEGSNIDHEDKKRWAPQMIPATAAAA